MEIYKSLRNVLALPAVVDQGVSVGDMAVVEGHHGQGSFQAEGHQEHLACGAAAAAAGVEDVRDRTLEDNRLDQDQGVRTLEVVLAQVRILFEAGSPVAAAHLARVPAPLGRAEGEDRGVGAVVMGQGVVDPREVRKLTRGRGVQRGAVVHQDQVHRSTWDRACHWGWDLVRKVEGGSSRPP